MAKKKDHAASGSAIAGGGAVVAGTGFIAGGVPGVKAKVDPLVHPEPGLRGQARKAKAFPGGIFGFRHNAHAGGLYGFKQRVTRDAWKGEAKSANEAFVRGRAAGKIAPEEKVLRHLAAGKKAAGVALAAGGATTAYGVHRARQEKVKKNSKRASDKYNGALVGVGATGAAVTGGATHALKGQERKWSADAAKNTAASGRLIPNIHGVSDADIRKNPRLLHGVHPHVAEEAGRLRGAAAQGEHFADVYRSTGKVVGHFRGPSVALAAAGAGGLAVSRKKKTVKKNMSDAELRRRQKLQSQIGRTTSTMGLGGLALLGTAAATKKNPGKLTKIPGLKKANPDKLRNAAINTGVVSSGIGGVGGFNQASIYSAESKRRQTVKKSDENYLDIPYMGDEGDAELAYADDDRLDA